MPVADNDLVRSGDGMIVPQYFNVEADNFEALQGGVGAFALVARKAIFEESVTPLTGAAIFVSDQHDALYYSRVRVRVFTDQAGTLDVQVSNNLTDWIDVATAAVQADVAETLEVLLVERYCRFHYTNGATAQTQFILSSAFLGV